MNAFDEVQVAQQSFSYLDLTGRTKWNEWTPTRTGWTDVGTPTVLARFMRVGAMVMFQIRVVPDTSVATTAGTSYITLPITARGLGGDGSMYNATALTGIGVCAFDVSNSRVYVPSQIATGNTVIVAGFYEG